MSAPGGERTQHRGLNRIAVAGSEKASKLDVKVKRVCMGGCKLSQTSTESCSCFSVSPVEANLVSASVLLPLAFCLPAARTDVFTSAIRSYLGKKNTPWQAFE